MLTMNSLIINVQRLTFMKFKEYHTSYHFKYLKFKVSCELMGNSFHYNLDSLIKLCYYFLYEAHILLLTSICEIFSTLYTQVYESIYNIMF